MFRVCGLDSVAYMIGNILSMIIAWINVIFVLLGISSITLVIYTITVNLFTILADITKNIFKREVGIKDINTISGHKGILDRIYSLIVAITVFPFILVSHII
ncbi:phosphatidate cytidylyltransferase [Candidatus Ishikawella capsulata]|uniref:phosphatidate cytidylyltransferase n=1 Tax=Candidatus Ishikawella capsulata TaxID=168169 RepID=UPI000597D1B2|nr:phosphatidate cytidylyltransferase [Candidatus Ishikawaella capsulata]